MPLILNFLNLMQTGDVLNYHLMFPSLSIALSTLSCVANEENLKYPSPEGPKPDPGVPTTWASFSSLSKSSHDLICRPEFTHTYGRIYPAKDLKAKFGKTFTQDSGIVHIVIDSSLHFFLPFRCKDSCGSFLYRV